MCQVVNMQPNVENLTSCLTASSQKANNSLKTLELRKKANDKLFFVFFLSFPLSLSLLWIYPYLFF